MTKGDLILYAKLKMDLRTKFINYMVQEVEKFDLLYEDINPLLEAGDCHELLPEHLFHTQIPFTVFKTLFTPGDVTTKKSKIGDYDYIHVEYIKPGVVISSVAVPSEVASW